MLVYVLTHTLAKFRYEGRALRTAASRMLMHGAEVGRLVTATWSQQENAHTGGEYSCRSNGNIAEVLFCPACHLIIFFFMLIYFWERQSMSRRRAEREGDTESEPGSRLWVVSISSEPDTGLKPMNHEMMTWAEVRRLTDWATQVPQHHLDYCSFIVNPEIR